MPVTLSVTTPITAEDAAIMAAVATVIGGGIITQPSSGNTGSNTGSTGGSTAPVTTAPAANLYFPADAGNALFPSPENSRVVRNSDGTFSSKPYLVDSTGVTHRLVMPSADFPNGYTVNGARTGGGGSEEQYNLLLLRQHEVYAQRSTGQWQHFNPAQGSMYNSSLPDAFVSSTGGSTGTTDTLPPSTVKARTLAAPMMPAPGTAGVPTVTVGADKQYQTIGAAIAAAMPGATIVVDPAVYKEAPPAIQKPLKIVGNGGQYTVDCDGLTALLAWGKAAFVLAADFMMSDAIVKNVARDQEGANLTCAVRPDAGCGYFTATNCDFSDCQVGVGSGEDTVKIVLNGCKLARNGLPDGNGGRGYTHNIYTGHGASLTLNNCSLTNPDGGHALKHRGWELSVTNTVISGGMEAAVIDMPNGSVAPSLFDNCTVTQVAGAYNHTVLDYGTDSFDNGNGGVLFKGGSITANADNPKMMIGAGGTVTIDPSCKVGGNKIEAVGGKIVGL